MNKNIIFIRKESFPNEYRTPMTPSDVSVLIQHGYIVYVQSSNTRVYSDSEYEQAGAILTSNEWHGPAYKNALIIGIKELDGLEHLDQHTHVYFSHSFKHQSGSKDLLERFLKTNSCIFDFEYICSNNGERLLSFGNYAGLVGATLGLQQFVGTLKNVKPWKSIEEMIGSIELSDTCAPPKIAVIGWKGRCGKGVCTLLQKLGMEYVCLGKNDRIDLLEYDIVYNCILLDPTYTQRWIDTSCKLTRPLIIVDISCDTSKPNNPISIYSTATTWDAPVIEPIPNCRVIAIENLPSLLPKESSDYFSSGLQKLLVTKDEAWERARSAFHTHINLIGSS